MPNVTINGLTALTTPTDNTLIEVEESSTSYKMTRANFLKLTFTMNDGEKATFGTGGDGEIYSSSDDLYIDNTTQDKDIIFRINDQDGGGPGQTLLTLDGSASEVISKKLRLDLTQDYLLTDVSTALAIQSQTAASNSLIWQFASDGDGTDIVGFDIFGLGTPSDIVNRERLRINWDTSGNTYLIESEADGTGTLRPIIIRTEGNTNQLYLTTDGKVALNETSPDCSAGGITLNQGAATTPILTFKNSGVAHGGGSISAENDTPVQMGVSSALGGFLLNSINETGTTVCTRFHTYSRDNASTTKSTAGRSLVEFYIAEHDGADNISDVVADGDVFGIRVRKSSADATVLIVDEDGDIHTDSDQTGGLAGTFDDQNDLELCQALNQGYVGNWQDKAAKKNRKLLQDLGIMNKEGWYSRKGFDKLTLGTLSQIANILKGLANKLNIPETELLEMARG